MAPEPVQQQERMLACLGCDRSIECCSFCDEEDCRVAICYRCVVLALGESAPSLHTHGG